MLNRTKYEFWNLWGGWLLSWATMEIVFEKSCEQKWINFLIKSGNWFSNNQLGNIFIWDL